MSRVCCTVCLRPEKTCICHLFCNIDNSVNVIVLQHPTEVSQTKGTVTLLANSLQQCEVVVGEDYTHNDDLLNLLRQYKDNVYLLYPSESASVLSSAALLSTEVLNDKNEVNHRAINLNTVKCIIVIDGTWKKAYKMYMLNTFLHDIPHLTLPESTQGDYKIRKTQKENALSSLEACTYALMSLEVNVNKYQPLLSSFKKFNDFQLAYRK